MRSMVRGQRAAVIEAASVLERRIASRLDEHFAELGFGRDERGELLPPDSLDKAALRAVHAYHRAARLRDNQAFLAAATRDLLPHFANGTNVRPKRIEPRLQLISGSSWESDLFRFATLLWSVPVSQGYGRRMRYLVWDESNGKLIGLIGLGDPTFNSAARDNRIGWTAQDRKERLAWMMDAFVLGAVPPYNFLLGGKLMACLVRTRDVARTFTQRYHNSVGIIGGEAKRPGLVAVTTASALGRSSVYNRLTLHGIRYFEPLGYSGGWGHFHIPDDLFMDMRRLLHLRRHPYAHNHGYGEGPNWRLRVIRAALEMLGIRSDLARHGVRRELFISWLADNATAVLRGDAARYVYPSLYSANDVALAALERWIIPRAFRDPSYRDWRREMLLSQLSTSTDGGQAIGTGRLLT